MKKIYLYLVFLGYLNAQVTNTTQVGTTSGNFVLIPVFASSTSMGNTSVSTAKGAEALYYNPAGIVGKSEVAFSSQDHLAGIKTNFFGTVFSFESSAIGFALKSLDYGDIKRTTVENPEGVGLGTYSPSSTVFGFSYANRLTEKVSAGLTMNIISERVLNVSATAVTFDAGIQYAFSGNASLGIALKNIGSKLKYSGEDLVEHLPTSGSGSDAERSQYSSHIRPTDLPVIFQLGLSYTHDLNDESYLQNQSTLNVNNAGDNEMAYGVEYGYNFIKLRAGYDFSSAWIKEYLKDYSLGFGLNVDLSESSHLSIDYAYVNIREYFDAQNMFSIKLSF